MCNRKIKDNKPRITKSSFSLTYRIPEEIIPDVSLTNHSFWKEWYLYNLKSLEGLEDKNVQVNVYWLNGELRCNWRIKPRLRASLSNFRLSFEECNSINNSLDNAHIFEPLLVSGIGNSSSIPNPSRPESKEKLTRFRGSHLLLTYSKLPRVLVDSLFATPHGASKSPEEIRHFFQSTHGWDNEVPLEFQSFAISREIHKDGTPHIHLYAHLHKLPKSLNVNSFDIWTGHSWSHPNIQSSKSLPTKGIDYVIKDGDFIADSSLIIVNTPGFGYQHHTIKEHVEYLAETVNVTEAKKFYRLHNPKSYRSNWPKMKRELEDLRKSHVSEIVDSKQSPYYKDGPEFPFLEGNPQFILLIMWFTHINHIKNWWDSSLEDSVPSSLVLTGPPNIGKGEFVRSHLRKFISEGSVVWAQSKDDLHRVDAYKTKIVVLDDVDWRIKGVYGETESKASLLLSTITDRTVERRYSPDGYFLPERTVVIIISNPNKLPNFMGGHLNTENSRKLTDKEEAYISANPDLYVERIHYEDLNNPNPKKYRPYKLEDLPPEKHIEAGYCDEPGLHNVLLDIYPNRCLILRLDSEDILFEPNNTRDKVRRDYNSGTTQHSHSEYFNWMADWYNHPRQAWKVTIDHHNAPVESDWDKFYRAYGPSSSIHREYISLIEKIRRNNINKTPQVKTTRTSNPPAILPNLDSIWKTKGPGE